MNYHALGGERNGHKQVLLPPEARILGVQIYSMGTLLLTTPALAGLRRTYPRAHIDLLASSRAAQLLVGWEVLDDIIELERYLPSDGDGKPNSKPPLSNLLRCREYDAVIVFAHLFEPITTFKLRHIVRSTCARWRVGLDNGNQDFLNVRVEDHGYGAKHEADYFIALVEALGAQVESRRLVVPLTDAEAEQAGELLGTIGAARPLIAMHPGSGPISHARRWPEDKFAALADTLYQRVGGHLLLLGGMEEADLHARIFELMCTNMPRTSLAGACGVRVTTALLGSVDLFIGNDSGPMHLAVAAGTPTVAIFGLSNHRAWGPYLGDEPDTERVTVVHRNLSCMPCFFRDHEIGNPLGCATRDCLTGLGVDEVADAALRALTKGREYGHL